MEAMDWWHCLKWVSHLKSPELQEDLIATVLNISTVDNNKELVAEHHAVIPLLAVSMRLWLCNNEKIEKGEVEGKWLLKLTDSLLVTRSSLEGFVGSEVGSVKISQAKFDRSCVAKTMMPLVTRDSCYGAHAAVHRGKE
ncbi:hypothetical protein V6N12_024038 [Hibiscus sabdariffa]|uniref:Uncharacterized protein n=1 Tax=Hibiscus sabdariffa TaxID=183260 RepID=A0ABR2FZF4_9ROSI